MFSDDKLKENLLNPRPSRRGLWWNVGLLILVIIVAVVIYNGVMKRRRAKVREIPPRETVAMKPTPATPPATVPRKGADAVPAPTPQVQPAPTPSPTALAPRVPHDFLKQVRDLYNAGEKLKAREQAYTILGSLKDPSAIRAMEDLLGEINIDLIMTPAAMPEKTDYVVKPGDSLARIAKQHGTTIELLQKSNQIRGHMIRPGDCMRVCNATFSLRVSKSRNELEVYANDRFFKRYRVGTGKHGTTPTGIFVINDKIQEPPWWRPDGKVVPFGDKENVLGTRWLSLQPVEGTDPVRGYGIHGTWDPETIGKQASAGCVRLLNEEVEQLYVLLPLGTRVVVEE
ncbi:MAG: L,D-transpeptidase family protein [Kiritimatiellia bacterium]|jgi:hypothetical protein